MEFDVLYLDNHLLIVNKSPGFLAQADKTGDSDLLTLARDFLKKKFNRSGNVYLGLVHRLDRPVSGIMALARTTKAASRLSAQFRNNTPQKRYLALVEGNCSGQGTYIDYILKQNKKVRIIAPSHPKALYAELAWRVVINRNHLSLLDIMLKTGRPHQIRVQLANAGFPILGDLRYGAQKKFDRENIALHNYLLGLEHPVKKQYMQWKVKPPLSWDGYFDDVIQDIINVV